MPPYTPNFYFNPITPCECCKLKYTTSTATTHKWTEEEVKEEILYYAKQLTNAKWYERGEVRKRLKHWTDKLIKLQEVKQEFFLKD